MSNPQTLSELSNKIDDLTMLVENLISVVREIRDGKRSLPAQETAASQQTINLAQPEHIDPDPGSVVIKFGKHKGERLDRIPDGYLIWILQKDWNYIDGHRMYPDDAHLLNAARTLWHQRQGTLIDPLRDTRTQPHKPAPKSNDIPF